MSIDVGRHHIIRVETLRYAFAAAAELFPRSRTPAEIPLILPDGTSIVVPFGPEEFMGAELSGPPYAIAPGVHWAFDYAIRVFVDDELAKYLDPSDEHY